MVELISRNVYNACASVIATRITPTCWSPFIHRHAWRRKVAFFNTPYSDKCVRFAGCPYLVALTYNNTSRGSHYSRYR